MLLSAVAQPESSEIRKIKKPGQSQKVFGPLSCSIKSHITPKADMCSALAHVRFVPIADMCSAVGDVRFVPKADIRAELDVCYRAEVDIAAYSRSVSARMINEFGSVIPSDLAAFRLRANSNRVGRSIGKSAGRAPLRTLSMYPATRRISSLVLGP